MQSHVSKLGPCLVFRVIVLYKSFGDFHRLLEFYFNEVTETYVKVKNFLSYDRCISNKSYKTCGNESNWRSDPRSCVVIKLKFEISLKPLQSALYKQQQLLQRLPIKVSKFLYFCS